MTRKRKLALVLLLATVATVAAARTRNVFAQQKADGQANKEAGLPKLEELAERIGKFEQVLERVKGAKAAPQDRPLLMLPDVQFLGHTYYGAPDGSRFFACRLLLGNTTDAPMTIKRGDISLTADATTFTVKDIPPPIQSQSFSVRNQTFQLNDLQAPEATTLPPKGTALAWAVFTQLPLGGNVPKLNLRISVNDKAHELNLSDFALGTLDPDVHRLGPRDCLALLTIAGELDSVSLGNLVEELDRLAASRVARVVVAWADSSKPVDPNLLNWLVQSVLQAGRGEVNNPQFPTIPASIQEFHLAHLPGEESASELNRRYNNAAGARIHETAAEAVVAALASAYEVLPRDELLREIQQGNALTRAAALSAGGGRLGSDKLPLILKFAEDPDPGIQRAALVALRHFGEQAAVDVLIRYAGSESEGLSEAAVESLAGSRYPEAQQALLDLLSEPSSRSRRKLIVSVLARYPRALWSETIYRFSTDRDPDIAVEALKALARIGHPQLLDVLEHSLAQKNAAVRNAAFALLVARTDPASEELALKYALESLEKSAPGPETISLLIRTKDRRAVPLLLKQMSASENNRSDVINVLAQIGDETVADALVQQYGKLKNYEQSAVLTALVQMRSPRFLELAEAALTSEDRSLVSTACQGLQTEGSASAVRMLAHALRGSNDSVKWSYVCNALAAVATPDARDALLKARDEKNEQKRRYAENALRSLRQRSPGYQYIYQGQHYAQQQEWKTAIAQYSLAIEIDPELPEAYAGRANAHLKLDEITEAHKDFSKAAELDSQNSQAVTGLAVVLVLQGDYEAGIKAVEDARPRFPNDALYLYNAACVYGRAVEQVLKRADVKDRDVKLNAYREKAIGDLKQAVKQGFQDFTWLRKDPDLKSLHDLPEFQGLQSSATAEPANEKKR